MASKCDRVMSREPGVCVCVMIGNITNWTLSEFQFRLPINTLRFHSYNLKYSEEKRFGDSTPPSD